MHIPGEAGWHQSPMPLWRRARPQRQATLAHRRLHPPRVPRAPESPAAVLDGFHGASINLHLDHNARSLKKASAVCFQSGVFWATAPVLGPQRRQRAPFCNIVSGLAGQRHPGDKLPSSSYEASLQASRNKLMHSLHGNTATLSLQRLIHKPFPEQPPRRSGQVLRLDWMGSDIFAFTGPQLTGNFLLSRRTPTTCDRPDVILPFTSPQTTTLTPDTTQSYLKGRRSGRRAFHVSQDHQKLYYRRPIGNRYHKNHIIHRINRIQKKLETRRTPPSRGVPEAHLGANKEGPPQGGQKGPA